MHIFLQDLARIGARLCKNLACKTCLARARDMSLFLHDSCTILHQSCLARSCKKTCKLAGNYFCSISCKILHHFLCKIMCKNRARKGTYRVHVPSKSCMQNSSTILHDLESSFLLGWTIAEHYNSTTRGSHPAIRRGVSPHAFLKAKSIFVKPHPF